MSSFPQLDAENATIKATIKTNMGDIKLALFKEQTPKTVENFIGLSKEGKYDNVIFHRVINGFMIQGGDKTGDGTGSPSLSDLKEVSSSEDKKYAIGSAHDSSESGHNLYIPSISTDYDDNSKWSYIMNNWQINKTL